MLLIVSGKSFGKLRLELLKINLDKAANLSQFPIFPDIQNFFHTSQLFVQAKLISFYGVVGKENA